MITSLTRARGGARSPLTLFVRSRLRDKSMARQATFDFSRLDERILRDIGIWRFEVLHGTGYPLLRRSPR